MKTGTVISLLLAIALLFSLGAGTAVGFAEDYVPEILPQPTADGAMIDGDALTRLFDNYLKENNCAQPQQTLSIAVWYPDTNEYWYYNPDVWMYGVNWYKLPISMYLTEKVSKGELTWDTVVNGITLEYAVSTALEYSSNPSAQSMIVYLGGNLVNNCSELTRQYADLPESYFIPDYYNSNVYTARLMLEITKTLYLGGDERFPIVLENMKKSQPEDMFNRDWSVRNDFEIAQTHAAYWGDGAGDYMLCTGIIYTPSPILLTVMMENIADLDIMGGVAWRIAHLGQALGQRLQAQKLSSSIAAADTETVSAVPETAAAPQNEAATAEEAPVGSIPEASASSPADSALPAETEVTEKDSSIISSASEEPAAASQEEEKPKPPIPTSFLVFMIVFFILFAVVVTVAIVLMVREKRQSQHRRRRRTRRD